MSVGRSSESGRQKRKASESGSPRRRRNRSASPIREEPSASGLPTLSEAHSYFTNTFGPPENPVPDVNVFLTRKIMRFARRWRAIANENLSRIGQTQARWEALYWIAVSQGGADRKSVV